MTMTEKREEARRQARVNANRARLEKALSMGLVVRLRYNGKFREGTVEQAGTAIADRVLMMTQDGYRTFMLNKIEGMVDVTV